MELKFNNIQELYELLLPALETKEIQLRREDYLGLSKKHIFEYMRKEVWKQANNLRLHQMVSDILNADNSAINSYNEM